MDEPIVLTQEDRKLLTRIDRAVRGEARLRPGLDGHDGLALLVSSVPEADPAFERQLEARLVGRLRSQQGTEDKTTSRPVATAVRGRSTMRRYRGMPVAAIALMVVALTLAWVGPHRVWAQIQQWLGYVPGIGFVNLEETRVLTAPVAVTRGGVTLRVEQVLAQPGGTTILLSSEGLPPEDRVWPQGVSVKGVTEPLLELPDGRLLAPETFNLRWGGGTLAFPAVPADVFRIRLILPRLPLVPAGVAAEDWSIALDLRPASGELVTALFPQPYGPMDASDAYHDVTLRVLEVAHSADETAVKLQLQWSKPEWEAHFIRGFQTPSLRDDLGHVYLEQVPDSGSGSLSQSQVVMVRPDPDAAPTPELTLTLIEHTLTFAPVSPAAQRLTLTMGGFDFNVPAKASLALDLGDHPEVGDSWPLDIAIDVAGIPVHVGRARLIEEQLGSPGQATYRTVLEFDVDPAEDGTIGLCGLSLDGKAAGFRDGGTGGYDPQSKRVRAGLVVEEGKQVPTGTISVQVNGASICLNDTWTVAWEVPGAGQTGDAHTVPVVLHPRGATETRSGLALQVEEAVLTDRLTGVRVGLADPQDDVTLQPGRPWLGPGTYPRGMILEDDRGRRYEYASSVTWRPLSEHGADLTVLDFEPLQPLARRLTLHIPAVSVVEPATATFDVAVPDQTRMILDAGDQPWPTSEPWAVDIPLEIASYRLRFTEARLAEFNGTTLLMLISELYVRQHGDRQLAGLQIASVTAPDGRGVDLEIAISSAGPQGEDGESHRARLAFDVIDPKTLDIQRGHYHVEIDGAVTLVEGPWKLSWDVP